MVLERNEHQEIGDKDSVDSYFECITACSIEEEEVFGTFPADTTTFDPDALIEEPINSFKRSNTWPTCRSTMPTIAA